MLDLPSAHLTSISHLSKIPIQRETTAKEEANSVEESIEEVQSVYEEKFFVTHRGKKHKGWQSTCIHGIDGMFFKTMSGKQYGFESDSDFYHLTDFKTFKKLQDL